MLIPVSSFAQSGTQGFLYVAGPDQGKIVVIDTETYEMLDQIDVGGWPHGVEISTDGTRAYVAHKFRNPNDLSTSAASVIDVASGSVIAEPVTGASGFDAVVSRDGLFAYISNRDIDIDGSISVIDAKTFEVSTWTHPDGLGFPSGMFFSYENDQLMVAMQIDSTVAGTFYPETS